MRMATTRRIVHDAWRRAGVDQLVAEAQVEPALAQFAEPYREDKLAGVLASCQARSRAECRSSSTSTADPCPVP